MARKKLRLTFSRPSISSQRECVAISESLAASAIAQRVSESLSTILSCEATSATTRGAVLSEYHAAIAICRDSRCSSIRIHGICGVRDENFAASRLVTSRSACSRVT